MNPIRPLAIGGVTLPNNLLLAPLAGYTDAGFRRAAAVCGAGMTCTEMVSAKALHYGSGKTAELMFTSPEERVKAVQIFGSEPEVMAEAAAGPALAKFDVIDINMGCPMAKITGNGEGSALMKSPDLAGRIVEACVKAAGRPVTVKFRLGLDDANRNYLEFAKVCQSAGASAVTVHGRTTAQLYAGIADRDAIGEVVAALSIPVIANGDITDRQSMLDMFARTGCAGVMIARGALGNPMLFSELLEPGNPPPCGHHVCPALGALCRAQSAQAPGLLLQEPPQFPEVARKASDRKQPRGAVPGSGGGLRGRSRMRIA